ncbi:MAG: hypothetical protein CMA63_01385 [Euryarchaeota archaeon]|nr:hypothetical protein [Euryarchaeota archaeon]
MEAKKTSAEQTREEQKEAQLGNMLDAAFGDVGGLQSPPEEVADTLPEQDSEVRVEEPVNVEGIHEGTAEEGASNVEQEPTPASEGGPTSPPPSGPQTGPPPSSPPGPSSPPSIAPAGPPPSSPPSGPPTGPPPSGPPTGPPPSSPPGPSSPPSIAPVGPPPSSPPSGPPTGPPPSSPPGPSSPPTSPQPSGPPLSSIPTVTPDPTEADSPPVSVEEAVNESQEELEEEAEETVEEHITLDEVQVDEPHEEESSSEMHEQEIVNETEEEHDAEEVAAPHDASEQDQPSDIELDEQKMLAEQEIARLNAEVERLRQSMAGAAEVIEELETPPMPPVVLEDIVIAAHIVSDFARLARQLDREQLIRATMGTIAMLHPDNLGVLISTRNMTMLPRLDERGLCGGYLGRNPPRGAPQDWRILEVVLASVSLVTGGPAAVIHSHGAYTTAASCEKDLVLVQPIDEIGKKHIGKVIIVDPDYDNPEDFLRQIAEALNQGGMRCVVIRGMGAYAVGADLDQAWANAAMLEHSMRIVLLARQANLKI